MDSHQGYTADLSNVDPCRKSRSADEGYRDDFGNDAISNMLVAEQSPTFTIRSEGDKQTWSLVHVVWGSLQKLHAEDAVEPRAVATGAASSNGIADQGEDDEAQGKRVGRGECG